MKHHSPNVLTYWNIQHNHPDRHLLDGIDMPKQLIAYQEHLFQSAPDNIETSMQYALCHYAHALTHRYDSPTIDFLETMVDHTSSSTKNRLHHLDTVLLLLPMLSNTTIQEKIATFMWDLFLFYDDPSNADLYTKYAQLAEQTSQPLEALNVWIERMPRTHSQFMRLLEDPGLSLNARRKGLQIQDAKDWLNCKGQVMAWLSTNEVERFQNLPFARLNPEMNKEITKTYCPTLFTVLETIVSSNDWWWPERLQAIGCGMKHHDSLSIPSLDELALGHVLDLTQAQ